MEDRVLGEIVWDPVQVPPDRVPLEPVKEEPKPEPKPKRKKRKKKKQEGEKGKTPPGGLNEIRDLKALRILFDIEGIDFGRYGREAERVYRWGKEKAGSAGPEAVVEVKKLVKKLGYQSRGETLLRKVAEWIFFDNQIKEMKGRQKGL